MMTAEEVRAGATSRDTYGSDLNSSLTMSGLSFILARKSRCRFGSTDQQSNR